MYRETLALREKVLGKEHPSTLASMNKVGVALSRQGKYAEAENVHQETLALREKVLGKGHPLHEQPSRGTKQPGEVRGDGEDASRDAGEHEQSGTYVKAQSRNQEAISLLTTSLQLGEQIFGPKHPNIQLSLKVLKEW